jgi:hypothetical protein
MDHCPFCKLSKLSGFTPRPVYDDFRRLSDKHDIDCGKCGRYLASGTLATTDVDIDDSELKSLQAAIARNNKQSITPDLDTTNWRTLI